jgi:hypothetical protein
VVKHSVVVGDTSVRFCGLALHYKVIPGYLSLGLLGAPTPLFSMKKEGWGREFNKLGRSESKLTFYTALRAKCYWHSVKVSKEIYKTSRSSFSFFLKKKQIEREVLRTITTVSCSPLFIFFFSIFSLREKKRKKKKGAIVT